MHPLAFVAIATAAFIAAYFLMGAKWAAGIIPFLDVIAGLYFIALVVRVLSIGLGDFHMGAPEQVMLAISAAYGVAALVFKQDQRTKA